METLEKAPGPVRSPNHSRKEAGWWGSKNITACPAAHFVSPMLHCLPPPRFSPPLQP